MMTKPKLVQGQHPDSALDAEPVSTTLHMAIRRFEQGHMPDNIAALNALLDDIDPNVVRIHRYGVGNALHQAICMQGETAIQEVFDVLIARGAQLDVACEDNDGGLIGEAFDSLYDWIVGTHQSPKAPQGWMTNSILPTLLNAGAPWGDLDKRHDEIGGVVRLHPAWIRAQLNQVAQTHTRTQTPEILNESKKPKI